MQPSSRPLIVLTLLLYLLSGTSALVYEVVWSRYLGLLVGSDGAASLIVLSTFMAGLAIGCAVSGPVADRTKRPLLLFGLLEISIGVYALLFAYGFESVTSVYTHLARIAGPTAIRVTLQVMVCACLILFPAAMMGATFPLLSRFVVGSTTEMRTRVAQLYAINSGGGAIGAALSGLYWIPTVGLHQTVMFAATINVVIGVVASIVGRCMPGVGEIPSKSDSRVEDRNTMSTENRPHVWLIRVGVFLSGFSVMLYEVAWTRLLALNLGATSSAFSMMLIAFIGGITIGAWILYRWPGLPQSVPTFAWLQILIAMAVLASMFWFSRLPFWTGVIGQIFARNPVAFLPFKIAQGALCVLVSIVPLTLVGIALPVSSRILANQTNVGRSIGWTWAISTLGGVCGTLLTGLWLMPWIGLAGVMGIGIAANVTAGMTLLFRKSISTAATLCLVLLFGIVFSTNATFGDRWERAFTLTLWRFRNPPTSMAEYNKLLDGNEIIFYRDDTSATVSVHQFREGENSYNVLRVNGKPDASNTPEDMTTQLLLGHIPMLLHDDPKNLLVVGLGSGVTASATLKYPSTESVDVVEICPAMLEAAQFFPESCNLFSDPRARVTIQDAKTFLSSTSRRFDVLISEPSNPWMSGVASVFSREFYQDCHTCLRDDGLMVQWFHTYEASDEMVDTVLATLGSCFPFVGVWQPSPGDLILVASKKKLAPSLAPMISRFNKDSVNADMKLAGITDLSALLACEVIPCTDGANIPNDDVPLHSDQHPILEFAAQEAFYSRAQAKEWRQFDHRFDPQAQSLLHTYIEKHGITADSAASLVQLYVDRGIPDQRLVRSAIFGYREAQPRDPLSIQLERQLMTSFDDTQLLSAESQLGRQFAGWERASLAHQRQLANSMLSVYRAQRSVFFVPPQEPLKRVLGRLTEVDKSRADLYRLHLSELHWDAGDFDAFNTTASEVFAQDTRTPRKLAAPIMSRMIEITLRNNNLQQAKAIAQLTQSAGLAEVDPVLAMKARKAVKPVE